MRKSILLTLMFGLQTQSFGQTLDSMFAYHPMHLGDRWQYATVYTSATKDTFTYEIVGDTVMPNGHLYWTFARIGRTGTKSIAHWMRIDSSSGSVYKRMSDSYELQLDSLATPDSGYFSQSNYFEPRICYDRGPYTMLGISTRLRDVRGVMCSPEYTFALGLGEVDAYQDFCDGISWWSSSLFYARINGIEYGIPMSVSNGELQPTSFALNSNYPNPFNPSTTISFSLCVRSSVRITVVNVLGEQVAEWASPNQEAGKHAFSWSPRLPTGVYFCRLVAESVTRPFIRESQTIKMILLR